MATDPTGWRCARCERRFDRARRCCPACGGAAFLKAADPRWGAGG